MRNPIVTYCITVCNEIDELKALVKFLQSNIHINDQILIQYDTSKVSRDVTQYLTTLSDDIKVVGVPLNKNFAEFKNNLMQYCDGEYLFQIDADEVPNQNFIENLHDILEYNSDIDVFYVPRINTVNSITMPHINQWGWHVSHIETLVESKIIDVTSEYFHLLYYYDLVLEKVKTDECVVDNEYFIKFFTPIINFPDLQGRIYRNKPSIIWHGDVHEKLIGHDSVTMLPFEESYCLYHHKNIEKQIQQNNFYSMIIEENY